MTAGYSATPLWKKLNFKSGMRVAVPNAPAHYSELVRPQAATPEILGLRFWHHPTGFGVRDIAHDGDDISGAHTHM